MLSVIMSALTYYALKGSRVTLVAHGLLIKPWRFV